MNFKTIMMALAGLVLVSGTAMADADDAKWVAKCLMDNADAKVSQEVVSKYCICMNNKMDSNETQSITQWEKSHPAEMAACEREAGWK